MARLGVALVFHHHQPWYLDPDGNVRHPWVFTNAARYRAHLEELEEHPSIHPTFNVQPVLLQQWALGGKGFRYVHPDGTTEERDPSSAEATGSRELLRGYRRLARRGEVEFLTSPHFHPIMALMVTKGFPSDLDWHMEEGRKATKQFLGVEPQGLWVPEMAFNMEVWQRLQGLGVQYTVLEGAILQRKGKHPYQPYLLEGGDSGLTVFLRHTHISNHIAFDWSSDVEGLRGADLCLRHIRRSAKGRPFVVLAMDGENWMRGRGLLHHLYRGLDAAEDMETVTLHELFEVRGAQPLRSFPDGSWGKDHDFSSWIGSPAKDRMWRLLRRAKGAIEKAGSNAAQTHPRIERARWHLRVAQASDYTYWDTTTPGPLMTLGMMHGRRALELAAEAAY